MPGTAALLEIVTGAAMSPESLTTWLWLWQAYWRLAVDLEVEHEDSILASTRKIAHWMGARVAKLCSALFSRVMFHFSDSERSADCSHCFVMIYE